MTSAQADALVRHILVAEALDAVESQFECVSSDKERFSPEDLRVLRAALGRFCEVLSGHAGCQAESDWAEAEYRYRFCGEPRPK